MIPSSLIPVLSGALGAFFAAWAGAQLGFRKSKKERALDRRVAWHEETIQGLAQYEERLERLRRHAMHVVVVQGGQAQDSVSAAPTAGDLPRTIPAPAALWLDLADAEIKARGALRLADLYTDERTRIDCSVALSNSVNMVSGQWLGIGPEPQIPWLDLQSKASAAAALRRKIQDSLAEVLELHGALAGLLGPKFRKWRTLRRLAKIRKELGPAAS